MDQKKLSAKRIKEICFVIVILSMIIALYLLLGKEISKLYELNKSKDYTKIKEYMQSFGIKGTFIVTFIEMLQMIIVFIPAEFIQIAAGLAYPIYVALPICMLGVFLGSTVIFLIVRCLHIKLSYFEKKTGKIQSIVSKINKSQTMYCIMYILYIMPLIPFGAIAYFASSSDVEYKKYAFVCTTGVIPSIFSSYILGNVMYHCIGLGTKTFVLAILVVIFLMAILLLLTASIIKNRVFKTEIKKSNFFIYHFLYFFINIYFSIKFKIKKCDYTKIKEKNFLILGEHSASLDFYFMAKAVYPKRLTFVCNRYYFDNKKTSFLVKMLGAIPKSLFSADMETVKKILLAKKNNCSIAIFPEGRLSSCGKTFPLVENSPTLIKKLGLDTYIFNTTGGYFQNPKWRSTMKNGPINLHLKKLFSKSDLENMEFSQIESITNKAFDLDECERFKNENLQKNMKYVDIEGLDGILFMCPSCKKEYCLTSSKTILHCTNCKKNFEFDESYLTSSRTISNLYNEQKEYLKLQNNFDMVDTCIVESIIDGKMQKCGNGTCMLSENGFKFEGEILGKKETIKQTPSTLKAMAFSCKKEFEFYYNNKLLYFYPTNLNSVTKWSILWDILVERSNQK